MTNIFNKLFYNKDLNKKAWTIKGVETDPTQNEEDDDIKIKDTDINLIITKEKGLNDIMATIQVNGQEYSFIIYDEVIKHINKLHNQKQEDTKKR
jgi:hypothetical protein